MNATISQTEKPKNQKPKATNNSKTSFFLGGLLSIGIIAGATAYSLGLFESEKKKKSAKNRHKVRIIGPSKQLAQLTPAEFSYLQRMDKSKLPDGLKRLKVEVEEQVFAKGLKRDRPLDDPFCERIARIKSEQSKYNLSEAEMETINCLDAECKKRAATQINPPELSKMKKENQVTPPENKKEKPLSPPSNAEPEPEEPHLDDSDTQEHAAIISFLKTTIVTLEALLQNDPALSDFQSLNQLDTTQRLTELGNEQAVADAFDQLLDVHIRRAKKDVELLSDELGGILKLANSNSTELKLKKEQIDDILMALKKPLESAVRYLQDGPNLLLDTSALNVSQKADLETAARYIIKSNARKVTQHNPKLTLDDFLCVYNTQLKIGFKASLKISKSTSETLITAAKTLLASCDDTLKTTIITVNENAEEYLKIYHSYVGVKDLVTKSEQIAKATRYLCAKAIISQATEPKEFFEKNSYQALYLAFSAHNLLRGELKNLGIVAGPAAVNIENSTAFKSFLRYEMNFFSYWDETKILQFTDEIKRSQQNMNGEIKNPQVDMNAFLQKYRAFVVQLDCFLRNIHFMFKSIKDKERMKRIAAASEKASAWLDRIDLYIAFLTGLPNPGSHGKLILAVADQDFEDFTSAIEHENLKAKFAEIVAYSEAAKQRTNEDTIENATWEVMSKYSNYRDVLFNSISDSAKRCVALNISSQKVAYLTFLDADIFAFTDELSRNAHLTVSSMELCASVLAQFNISGKPTADMTTELQKHAKRAEFLYKLRTDASEYCKKLQDLANSLYNSLTIQFPSNAQKAYLCGRLGIDAHGNIVDVLRFNAKKVLPLLIIPGITPKLKQEIALFYGLVTAYVILLDIPKNLVDKNLPLTNFLDQTITFESFFALEFIQSRGEKEGDKFKVLTSGWAVLGTKKHEWKHTVLALQPLQAVIDRVTREMNDYANVHNKNGFITVPVIGDVSYPPFKYQKATDDEMENFSLATTDLAVWAILTCHKPRCV